MSSQLIAVIWLAVLVFIYILGYLLNKKTPKPKGCENITADCAGCQMVDCTHNPVHHEEEKR